MSGYRRSRFLGTFGISVTSSLGVATQQLLTPIFDRVELRHSSAGWFAGRAADYYHRVLDGGTAADAGRP